MRPPGVPQKCKMGSPRVKNGCGRGWAVAYQRIHQTTNLSGTKASDKPELGREKEDFRRKFRAASSLNLAAKQRTSEQHPRKAKTHCGQRQEDSTALPTHNRVHIAEHTK